MFQCLNIICTHLKWFFQVLSDLTKHLLKPKQILTLSESYNLLESPFKIPMEIFNHCKQAQPLDYYPLLIFCAGNDEVPIRSPRAIKRGFRALVMMRKETWRPSKSIPQSMTGATNTISGILTVGWAAWHQTCWQQMRYTCLKVEKGLLQLDRFITSSFKWDLKREREKNRLNRDEPGGDKPASRWGSDSFPR